MSDTVRRKTVLLAINTHTGTATAYSSIVHFCAHNPGYSQHTIKNYLSRKKKPYKAPGLLIIRVPFYPRATADLFYVSTGFFGL